MLLSKDSYFRLISLKYYEMVYHKILPIDILSILYFLEKKAWF